MSGPILNILITPSNNPPQDLEAPRPPSKPPVQPLSQKSPCPASRTAWLC